MVVVVHLEFVKLPRHPTFKRKRGVTCAYPNTSRCELLRELTAIENVSSLVADRNSFR
jgi:hypothetical protein